MGKFIFVPELGRAEPTSWPQSMMVAFQRHQARYSYMPERLTDRAIENRERVWKQWNELFVAAFRRQWDNLRFGGGNDWCGAGFCERCERYDTIRWDSLEMCRNDECSDGDAGLCPHCRGDDPEGSCHGEWHGAVCQSCLASDERERQAELWR